MDDTVLNLRFGEHSLNGGGEAGQVIRTGNEDVLHTPVPQAIEDGGPVLGALILAYPHAQYVLPAVQIDANGDIHRLFHHLSLAADMVVDRVQKHHRINALQWPLLPFPRHGENLVRDPAHGRV